MTNRERYKRAFSAIQVPDDFCLEGIKMKQVKKQRRLTAIAATAAVCAVLVGSAAAAYTVDAGGIQRMVQLWLNGDQTQVEIQFDGNGTYTMEYTDRAGERQEQSGGMVTGYPENCIESFEKTLSMMPSFFEIDPRLTKDSVIVLMHDATIDRTTDGTGRVSDYTYDELRRFRLRDREGNLTQFRIPTLEECIRWSRGKTVLNLDIKDVPLDVMSAFINRLDPPNVMYTVHDARQARMLLDRDPDAMFSAWCKDMDEYRAYEEARIPWSQMQAYVGPMMIPARQELYDSLHANGVMCMISVAPTHDRRASDDERVRGYELEIPSGCDVIETDYPYLFRDLDLRRTRHIPERSTKKTDQ